MENICEKDYAAFMEETLQRMVQMPVSMRYKPPQRISNLLVYNEI